MNRTGLPFVAAALFVAVPSLAETGHSVDDASAADQKDAQKLYAEGMDHFDHDDYDAALSAFHDSYEHVNSPNSHFMEARSLARLGRNIEAYAALEQVIAETDALGKRYADTARAARDKLAEVRPRIGLLTIKTARVPKGTHYLVSDVPITTLEKPIPVLPGETTIVAVTPDGVRHTQTVNVQPGADVTTTVDIVPEAPKPKDTIEEDTAHIQYHVELEGHIAGETLSTGRDATRGAGPGFRASVVILPRGIINGLNDSLAISSGFDWLGTSDFPHTTVPILAQWNIWLAKDLSLLAEPGAELTFGIGTHIAPSVYAGLRYRVFRSVHITARVGVPNATLGASIVF